MYVQTSVGVEMPISSEEDGVVEKVSRRLVWFLVLLFVCPHLARINISSAALWMSSDLGLTATTFGLASSTFCVAYIMAEIPSNLMMPRFDAGIRIPRIMITWESRRPQRIAESGPTAFMRCGR
jgi:sugar phosphate permease